MLLVDGKPVLGGGDTPVLGGWETPVLGGCEAPVFGGRETPVFGGCEAPLTWPKAMASARVNMNTAMSSATDARNIALINTAEFLSERTIGYWFKASLTLMLFSTALTPGTFLTMSPASVLSSALFTKPLN